MVEVDREYTEEYKNKCREKRLHRERKSRK